LLLVAAVGCWRLFGGISGATLVMRRPGPVRPWSWRAASLPSDLVMTGYGGRMTSSAPVGTRECQPPVPASGSSVPL